MVLGLKRWFLFSDGCDSRPFSLFRGSKQPSPLLEKPGLGALHSKLATQRKHITRSQLQTMKARIKEDNGIKKKTQAQLLRLFGCYKCHSDRFVSFFHFPCIFGFPLPHYHGNNVPSLNCQPLLQMPPGPLKSASAGRTYSSLPSTTLASKLIGNCCPSTRQAPGGYEVTLWQLLYLLENLEDSEESEDGDDSGDSNYDGEVIQGPRQPIYT